ncbi:MAG: hypothetical protein WCB27_16335 [Thermoguttaceae bacterium]
MDVLDFLVNIRNAPQVPVVSTAALPETIRTFPVRLHIFQPRQELRYVLAKPQQRPLRHRLFEGSKYLGNARTIPRPKHDMNVFWHDNEGPKMKLSFLAAKLQCLQDPATRAIL